MTHDHRSLAIDLFNTTWDLLEKTDRTPGETHLMLHRSHASLWHWLQAGTGVHHQRGAWMVARVYAEIGWVEPARAFAREAEALLQRHASELADFDHAFMSALNARIAAAAGDPVDARRRLTEAKRLGEALAEDDREVFFDQLHAGAWYGIDPKAG